MNRQACATLRRLNCSSIILVHIVVVIVVVAVAAVIYVLL